MTHLAKHHNSAKNRSSPLLSIIIPFFAHTKNGHIHKRVCELMNLTFPDFVEVIFVDSTKNESLTAEYKNKCAKRGFLYVFSPQGKHYSLGKARNDAAENAAGRYLFFMDVDFIYSNIFWESLVQVIDRELQTEGVNKFLILPCLYLNKKATRFLGDNRCWSEFDKIRNSVLEGENKYVSTIAIISSTIIINRKYFLWLGGFRNDYWGHGCEEFDFIHRLSLNYPIAMRPDDYYLDDVQKFPADYKGFRRYFLYYGLPYLFEPVFLLHRHHARPLFHRFYRNRRENEIKLQMRMREYDQGMRLPALKMEEEVLPFHANHSMEKLPNISKFIKSLQASYGFYDKRYCGLFSYKKGVKPESGNLFRKTRKLFRNPKKFLIDMKIPVRYPRQIT